MAGSIRDWWRWRGMVDRAPYALLGLFLFFLKYNLDRLVTQRVFGRPWSLFSYLDVPGTGPITALGAGDVRYGVALLVLALPFIWVGITLTVQRLRAAGLPLWPVVLFFAPLLNLLFFAVLSILPSRPEETGAARPEARRLAWLDQLIPHDPLGSAGLAVLLTVPAGIVGAVVSVKLFGSYGWSLFVGLPFSLGLVATLLYGYHRPQPYGRCLAVASTAIVLLGLLLVLLAVEGVLCIVMAAPIALALAALGAAVGYVMQQRPQGGRAALSVLLVVGVVGPLLFGAEQHGRPASPPRLAVRTAVDVAAPPEAVWQHLIAFSEMPPPEDWLFRTGIAYPIRAEIDGEGVGAVRRCVFTTGAFVEPITVWDAPHRLAFTVAAQPPPMQEWTFYKDLSPAHLDGYFRSEDGQFLLTSLPGGRTRLEGTTWYRHGVWPNAYWRLWADWTLHRIHRRVLKHIKRLAEDEHASPAP